MRTIFSILVFLLFLSHTTYPQDKNLTPELLWSFGRVSDMQLSPDGKAVLYGITRYDIPKNQGTRNIYVTNLVSRETRQVGDPAISAYQARWRPDGKAIGFLSNKSGTMALWEINLAGSASHQVSPEHIDIGNFKYSPGMGYVSFSISKQLTPTIQDRYKDLDKASARLYDDLMFMHWDAWADGSFSHLHYSAYNGNGKMNQNLTDVMEGEEHDWPLAPFGDDLDMDWAPDENSLVYVCKKYSGTEYARNTNSDLYLYKLEDGTSLNLTESLPGYDKMPRFSPNGRYLAWLNMPRAGYESDRQRIRIIDLQTREIVSLTENFEFDIMDFTWDDAGEALYFVAGKEATKQVFILRFKADNSRIKLHEKHTIEQLTSGVHNINHINFRDGQLIAEVSTMSMPTEIFTIDIQNGDMTRITQVNSSLLENINLGNVEKRMVRTTDEKDMLTWIIYPPDFDPDRKYPALLYCQGGPHGAVDQFFSYRWNFQMMAANGYIVVAPNRRGLPSFGDDWNDDINRDWGGQDMRDYLSAIDAIAAERYVDKERLGAVGASYGGYSVFFLAGIHQGRFKTFIAHDGIYNLESFYGSTEELFFPDWELGGPYWTKDNEHDYLTFSPHRYVQYWDTPMLIIHGEKDYRIPYTQALEAFTALRVKNIPAKLLLFPEENHWILSAQNGILWQRTFFDWLDQWLK